MLAFEKTASGHLRPVHLHAPGSGSLAFGGHLLALLVIAATDAVEGRRLSSLHTVFARGVRIDDEATFENEVLALGRSAASALISVRQAGQTCVDALAVALTPQEVPLAHAPDGPRGAGRPADAVLRPSVLDALEMRMVDGVDLADEAGGGAPAISVWVRPTTPPRSVTEAQAMIAYASEPHFLGTALRPHAGWSEAQAFSRFLPAVSSHTLHFHTAPDLGNEWWLFVVESPHVAGGRVFGRADVFAEDGTLLASAIQENLIRPTPPAG